MRKAPAVALAFLMTTCVRHTEPVIPVMVYEWVTALSMAQASALSGRYGEADSVLASFAVAHAGSPEGSETSYWRAVFALDPANPNRSLKDAIYHLDRYVGDTTALAHSTEARTLRRIAGTMDSLSQPVVLTSASEPSEADSAATPKQQELAKEVQRLKEELEKSTAELDRIKRRLAAPKP